jgi:hypothetical protein
LSGDELSPEGLRLRAAKLGFDIACQESVEQVVGQEGQQGKGLDRVRIVINLHLKPRFGDTVVDDIGQKEVDAPIDDLAAQGRAKNTIKNVCTNLGILLGEVFRRRAR